ncbi:syncoilin [Xiphias gladius]|uniref:syncoilin n=1 Tax=Xiphias gladius TaxID=8245 RepID=UPI001A996BD2|nr:syncoilin [Xiphias gladius]
MEDVDDNISSTEFEPLFIKEDGEPDRTLMEQRECNTAQSGLTFTGTQLNPSSLIKPYLQEMDDLLKSCEELTGIPFGSRFSESYTETSMSESIHGQSKEEVTMESYRETSISPQAYLSTSYIDTHMDGAGTEDQPAQGQTQGMGTIINRCGVTAEVSRQTEMPITSAGNKLSETMVQYEGQLLGMLAMLESCMEETGMDFEPQDWATDESHEYVHISKNPHLYRGTTLVPIQQGRPENLGTHPVQLETWAAQHAEGDKVSKDSSKGVTVGSATSRSQQNPLLGFSNMSGISMERLERSGTTDQGALDLQFRFSGPSEPLDNNKNDPMYCEGTTTKYIFTEGTEKDGEITGTEKDDTEMPAEERLELKIDIIDLRSGVNKLGELGSQMEECIEEVQQLEKRRKELLAEVLELRGNKNREEAVGDSEEEEVTEEQIDSKVAELMNILKSEEEWRREERKREIQSLREERAEEERRMWKVNLERQGLQEELRKLKMRLFAMARNCTHSQANLNNQRREVELLNREEEKLQALVLQLTEEGFQLRSAQQQQLLKLQAEVHAQTSSQTSNTQEELTECRRHSCGDIQQYLQGGLRALEDRYEPILLALLKRREATAGALVKAKEQAQELRAQLGPLREEIQKLKLQRALLEEKLKLIHIHRREDVGQYRETVYCLEESSRELKTELRIQKKKTKEIEELRDSLTKQLLLYRAAIEDHNKCDHEAKT